MAVLGLLIDRWAVARRVDFYTAVASRHRDAEREALESLWWAERGLSEADPYLDRIGVAFLRDLEQESWDKAAYHGMLARKYERAARDPRLPIGRDPRPPRVKQSRLLGLKD